METAAKQNHLPFLTAKTLLKDEWDITMSDDEFIEPAYYIWRQIGNIARITTVFNSKVPDNLIINLPPDCEFVKSVSAVHLRQVDYKGEFDASGGFKQESEPNRTELTRDVDAKVSSDYTYGEQVTFTTGDGYIKLSSPNLAGYSVEVKYSSILVGEDGLPLLNDIEVQAIAANVAMKEVRKRIFRGVQGAKAMWEIVKPEADRLIQAAAIDEKFSDTDLDKVLDIQTSWDRKTFGNTPNFLQ